MAAALLKYCVQAQLKLFIHAWSNSALIESLHFLDILDHQCFLLQHFKRLFQLQYSRGASVFTEQCCMKRLYVSVRLLGHRSDKIALGGLRFYLISNVRTACFWRILKVCSQVKLSKLIENNKQVMSFLILVRLVRSQSR